MTQRPTRFEAYPTDRFIEIIKAWVNHFWPMTSAEAQELYESFGYRAYAPKPELFISDFSQIEPDSYVTTHNDRVGDARISMSHPCDTVTPQNTDTISRTFSDYCTAIEDKLKDMISHRKSERNAVRWTLRNGVDIRLAKLSRNISVFIGSPRMTQLRREEGEMGLTRYDEILEDD
ncbi:DUF6301 family protein [Pauljensenia hongkongensis]|uniref:DUF6301 family protein n=1 Tax=Pauljensenia hongkongensis TaxID=178339 RepID=UPI0001F666F0|nr:DUF6301 family protein [Pauljensenia hongkongensis]EFW10393.1 hypothetical protein HMPREF9005_0645 [Actinomyces sp. oral taxon 178 str. F0338]